MIKDTDRLDSAIWAHCQFNLRALTADGRDQPVWTSMTKQLLLIAPQRFVDLVG